MPSPPILDLDALLRPIPGENPAGESLRYSSVYDAIQEARRSDDVLAQGEWKRDTKAADWSAVQSISIEALSAKSKDLQLAVWLAEATVKRHGFPGLRDSLHLLAALQEKFWPSLYPAAEDGDLESRSGPLEWLNEKLPLSIRTIPLTRPSGTAGYSWSHWEESRTVDNLARQNPEAHAAVVAEGKIAGDQFDKAVDLTPRAHWEAVWGDLTQAVEEFARLDSIVDQKFGREAPSILGLKKAIEDCRALVEVIVKKKREQEPSPADEPARATGPSAPGEAAAAAASSSGVSAGGGPLHPVDRADALRRLAAVAAFFRRTEPHSPVAYLVQRAVQWGGMPLEAWLQEVIGNEDVLARVRETLGLKGQHPEGGG